MSKVLLDMSVSLDRFVAESVSNTEAILLGRQTYDQGDGLDGFAGSPYAVERFVVTHRAPERAAKGQMTFTFVTEGVESAVERANSLLGASPPPTRPPKRRIQKEDTCQGR